MNDTAPIDHNFEKRIRASFGRQGLINNLNRKIAYIGPGELHIEAPFDKRFTQQDGFLHEGIVATLMDSASRRDPACGTGCGYAAYTHMPADSRLLSVEFKANFINPARGDRFRAEGRVVKSSRMITVFEGKLFALQNEQSSLVALMQATMMCIRADS